MERNLRARRTKRAGWPFATLSLLLLIPLSAGIHSTPSLTQPNVCSTSSFGYNATRPDENTCLNAAAGQVQRDSRQWIVIDGHRDRSEATGISFARANAGRDYLVNERGIDASRILVRDFCATCPGSGGRGNRRIDVATVPAGSRLDRSLVDCAAAEKRPLVCSEPTRR
jgi:hypothetical protein